MNCKNCDAATGGTFCSACGQKSDTHRITIPHLSHELIHAVTHADKGFFLLMKDLVAKPGAVALQYIEGKRKKYFNPLSFIVITTAFSAYIGYKSGYFEALTYPNSAKQPPLPYYRESMQFMVEHGKMLGLILILPLLAFFAWIFFKRSQYNFAESFVLHSFVIGQTNILRVIIFIPAFLIAPHTIGMNEMIFSLVFQLYLIIAYKQFYKGNLALVIFKSLLIRILFIVFYWVLIWAFVATMRTITA
jgi:hypothetical protein